MALTAKWKQGLRYAVARSDQRRLAARPFSLVSDDCWGSRVYQHLDRPFTTPFVGMVVPPDDYIRLLSDLRGHLARPLEFGEDQWSPSLRRWVPYGYVGDVELQFLHYDSKDDAAEKWKRRVDRFDFDNVFVKLDASKPHAAPRHVEALATLPVKSVAFSAVDMPMAIAVPGWHGDGYRVFDRTQRVFDAFAWIAGLDPTPSRVVRALW